MGAIGAKESAPVGAQHLDGDLGGRRAQGDDLLRRGSRYGRGHPKGLQIGSPGLHHPLADQEEGEEAREGQQDIECDADHVHPEAAQVGRLPPPDPPGHRCHHRQPCGGGQEVLHREPQGLAQIAQGGLARIGLPVRVGDEADGGIEGQRVIHGPKPLGVQRQMHLELQKDQKEKEAQGVEGQNGDQIVFPVHPVVDVDAHGPVDPALDRGQKAGRWDGFPFQYISEVFTQGAGQQQQGQEQPSQQREQERAHWNRSGRSSATTRYTAKLEARTVARIRSPVMEPPPCIRVGRFRSRGCQGEPRLRKDCVKATGMSPASGRARHFGIMPPHMGKPRNLDGTGL